MNRFTPKTGPMSRVPRTSMTMTAAPAPKMLAASSARPKTDPPPVFSANPGSGRALMSERPTEPLRATRPCYPKLHARLQPARRPMSHLRTFQAPLPSRASIGHQG